MHIGPDSLFLMYNWVQGPGGSFPLASGGYGGHRLLSSLSPKSSVQSLRGANWPSAPPLQWGEWDPSHHLPACYFNPFTKYTQPIRELEGPPELELCHLNVTISAVVAANADYLSACATEMPLQQEHLHRALYLFTCLWVLYESLCDFLDELIDTAIPGRRK